MPSNSVIDYTADPVFRKEEWMGKKYPASDVPHGLSKFRDAALAIPTTLRRELLPDPGLSIHAFIALTLPTAPVKLISSKAQSYFSEAKPTKNVLCLRTRKLPSLEFIKSAEEFLGQALLNGAQSILDPAYKGEGSPLWTIQYWREMHDILKAQARWRRGDVWLQNRSTGTSAQPDIDQARQHLSSLA